MLRIMAVRPLAVLMAAAMVWGGIPCAASAAQMAQQPYSKASVVRLLKGYVKPKRVAELVRERGIDFQITPEVERELRSAGADDSLLATLRELAPKPPAMPPENPSSKPPAVTPARGPSAPASAMLKENPRDRLKYAWIPPGAFVMGCSPRDSQCGEGENPPHPVTITKGFWMGQTEVTVVAYKRFAAATQRPMPLSPNFNNGWANDFMPIVQVTWNDATAYCGWAGGRLPTEAEWEYAARAGSTAAVDGPLDDAAWFGGNSGLMTHRVGGKRANGFGLYDMLGNASEWVNDWYDPSYYLNSPLQDPVGPATGHARTLRGGSWANFPTHVRVSSRYKANPGGKEVSIGFRCAAEAAGP